VGESTKQFTTSILQYDKYNLLIKKHSVQHRATSMLGRGANSPFRVFMDLGHQN